jgi:Rrf2 family protein
VFITTRVDYAMHAMLAVAAAEEPVTVRKLADDENLSLNYLYAIITDLRRAGLVHIHRGPHGGVVLARPATELTVKDVVAAMDGTVISNHPPLNGNAQSVTNQLPTIWLAAYNAMLGILAQVSLADLLAEDLPRAVDHFIRDIPDNPTQPPVPSPQPTRGRST